MLTYKDLVSIFDDPGQGVGGLSTGIAELDRVTAGLRSGRMWLVTSPSQSGRTTFVLQVARLAAEARYPTAFLAGADPASRLGSMLISGSTGIPRNHTARDPLGDTWSAASQYTLTAHYPEGRLLGDVQSDIADADLVVVDDLDLWEPSGAAALEALVSMCDTGQRVLVTAPASVFTGLTPDESTAWSRATDLQARLIAHRSGPRLGEIDFDIVHHRDGPTARIPTAFQGVLARIVDLE